MCVGLTHDSIWVTWICVHARGIPHVVPLTPSHPVFSRPATQNRTVMHVVLIITACTVRYNKIHRAGEAEESGGEEGGYLMQTRYPSTCSIVRAFVDSVHFVIYTVGPV